MNNNLLQIKVKERLNKLASNDFDNIECWQIVEAFNKAQLAWTRRQMNGINQKREGDESSKMLIDDLQVLLSPGKPIKTTQYKIYNESELLPTDYLYWKRISTKASTQCCSGRAMVVYLTESADVDNLLIDSFSEPSFEWGETFATLASNRIRIYTNGLFTLSDTMLSYYRKPREIAFIGCSSPSTGIASTVNVESEFKDDIVEVIIDEAVSILAGDIESVSQLQISKSNVTNNT